jgi:hypothetical protein
MKSHFCLTIWNYNNENFSEKMEKNGVVDFRPIIDKMVEVGRMCRMHYGCYSVEDSRLKKEIAEDPAIAKSSLSNSGHPIAKFVNKIIDGYESEKGLGDSAEVGSGKQEPISSVTHDSEHGGIHIHYYIELNRTMRWSTVCNKFRKAGFDGIHVEVRRGWRETCREYHMGIKNYEPKLDAIISGEWGKWREDLGTSYSKEDYFELAANMIIHGYNPSQVAMRFPTWYIRHGYGVERLYNSLNRDDWGQQL